MRLLASPGLHRLQLLDSSATPRGTLAVLMPLLLLAGIASLPSHAGNARLLSSALSSANRRGWIFKGLSVMPAYPAAAFAATPEYYQKPASLCNLFMKIKLSNR